MRHKEGSVHHMLRIISKTNKSGLNECDKCYSQGYRDGVESLLDYFENHPHKQTGETKSALASKR